MATLKQVVDVLETLYPLRYAEQWDEPGLIVGDLRQPVRGIAFAAVWGVWGVLPNLWRCVISPVE